ncbi:serine hydrolase domain-containing protein [Streptomyces thermolineatus]|uniref:Serine hydrolase domain-containing protein n=1 Tax=Streptomyces thermolineatus TaxID=44033 RepID=A0ABP5Y702_9ACTN
MTTTTARPTTRRRLRRIVFGLGAAVLTATAVPTAVAAPAGQAPAAETSGIDGVALQQGLDAVHEAGMYGVYSAVRDGRDRWKGEAGVADVRTGRLVDADMRHRIGSVTKTFVAVAVLQQVEAGRIGLDDPVGDHLPELVPGERGRSITVRMLLNHTSGIADYVMYAYPSLQQMSPQSLDDNRFRSFEEEELVGMGLEAPPTGEPGEKWSYSNTNYILAGLLLEKATGTSAEDYITRNVIRKAGLRHTSFPRTPFVPGPHSKAYESLFGIIDPPRDYSVYHPSSLDTAGAMVSTMDDLNRFYRLLLDGRLLGAEQLAEMRRTVPVTDVQGNVMGHYGLGIMAFDLPCGRYWGHGGTVFGAGTESLTSEDGRRQMSYGVNLMKYQKMTDDGRVEPHPIDFALGGYLLQALCPTGEGGAAAAAKGPEKTDPAAVAEMLVNGPDQSAQVLRFGTPGNR